MKFKECLIQFWSATAVVSSLLPSTIPSSSPSFRIPTASPTLSPTMSRVPSTSPTFKPSLQPTPLPFPAPTTEPTHHPSPKPTAIPSNVPSSSPSISPSFQPTPKPSPDPTQWGHRSRTQTAECTGLRCSAEVTLDLTSFQGPEAWTSLFLTVDKLKGDLATPSNEFVSVWVAGIDTGVRCSTTVGGVFAVFLPLLIFFFLLHRLRWRACPRWTVGDRLAL
jgi:hypothetical protein